MTAPEPTATEITVLQALELLDGVHNAVAEGVANDRYVFWLGSGISRNLPGLEEIVERVLEFLREHRDHGNPDCSYASALNEAIEIAELPLEDREAIDYETPVESWPALHQLRERLARRYSKLLNIRIASQPRDYLLWNAVDLAISYPADAEPASEHLCLAILSIEGAMSSAASANWDGLLETAVRELSGKPDPPLQILVIADDFRQDARQTTLLKFHGCAVLAVANPDAYRAAIIASEEQITNWPNDPEHAVMLNALKLLATTKPTLMIGLSAQDSDIKDLFSKAKQQMNWTWPSDLPAQMFADERLGPDQRALLKVVYGEIYDHYGQEIERASLLRAYAAQTLGALVLYVIARKLVAYLELIDAPQLESADVLRLSRGIGSLRNLAATKAEPDRLAFIRALVQAQSRALSLFRTGKAPPDPLRYLAISRQRVDETSDEPGLAVEGLPQLAAALGLFGIGTDESKWETTIGPIASGRVGALKATSTGGSEAAVYFAASNYVAVKLELEGAGETTDDVVMIHSTGPIARRTRSPLGVYGRTGLGGARHVDMADLLQTSRDLPELMTRFREAAAL